MTEGNTMEPSVLAAGIRRADSMRDRINAIVRAAWWNNQVDDAAAAVSIDDLAWAVASNASIRLTVAEGEEPNVVENGIKLVTDSDLEYVILSVALPRLTAAPSPS